MTIYKYKLAEKFSEVPGPRYKAQGKDSGETFREIVVRLLQEHDQVEIDLNGTEGYGSSFLDEAFAKLVSKEGFQAGDLHRRLSFHYDDALQVRDLWQWIDEASPDDVLAKAG